MATASIDDRATELLEFVRERAKTAADWVDLHNAVFGIGAKFSRLFPAKEDREQFMKSDQHAEIQRLMDGLPRIRSVEFSKEQTGDRFILVLPKETRE